VRFLRQTEGFAAINTGLGHQQMREVGNLYTASLPAWMAAGLEQAVASRSFGEQDQILAAGYGSGDAAELIPMRLAPDWQQAAGRIGFEDSLSGARDIDEADYVALHEGTHSTMQSDQAGVFYIDRIGSGELGFSDHGIEYYRYGG